MDASQMTCCCSLGDSLTSWIFFCYLRKKAGNDRDFEASAQKLIEYFRPAKKYFLLETGSNQIAEQQDKITDFFGYAFCFCAV